MHSSRFLTLIFAGFVSFALQSCNTFVGDGDEDATPPEGGMSGDINETGGGPPAMGGGAAGFMARVSESDHGNDGSYPDGFTTVGNKLYFAADDGVNGRELWQYQHGAGVSLAADVRSGPGQSSNPQQLTRVGKHLFFTALDSGGTRILWFLSPRGAMPVQKFSGESMDEVGVLIGLQQHLIIFQSIGPNRWNAWQVGVDGGPADPLSGWDGMESPEVLAVAKSFAVLRAPSEPGQLYTCNAHSIKSISRTRLEGYGTEFAELRGALYFAGEDEFGQELWSFRPIYK